MIVVQGEEESFPLSREDQGCYRACSPIPVALYGEWEFEGNQNNSERVLLSRNQFYLNWV